MYWLKVIGVGILAIVSLVAFWYWDSKQTIEEEKEQD